MPFRSADEVTALSLALPAALACDIARQQGRGGAHSDSVTHWAMAAAGREGGDEVLVEIVVRAAASPNLDCYPMLDAAALAPERRSRFALRLFRAGAGASEDTGLLLMQFAVSLLRPHDAAPLASELLDLSLWSFRRCRRVVRCDPTYGNVSRLSCARATPHTGSEHGQ